MPITPRERLARVIDGSQAPGAFSAQLSVPARDVRLTVAGAGPVSLPVKAPQAKRMIAFARPARFGRGEQTLMDLSVRDTWEITPDQVTLTGLDWDAILTEVRDELGLPARARLRAGPHALLVYGKGQFFLPHQDSEKDDTMIGTLVVSLPSSHTGGELLIEHNGETVAYQASATEVSVAAFYADCRHEVKPVRTGCRVTLTCNLLLDSDPAGDVPAEPPAEAARYLAEHFTARVSRWKGDDREPPNRLVYLLDHEYTPRGLNWRRLKGADASRVALLRTAAGKAGCEAVLALADIKTTHSAFPADEVYGYRRRGWYDEDDDEYSGGAGDAGREYEIQDLVDSDITLIRWTGPDGTRLEETSLSVSGDEVCASTQTGDLEPYSSEYEGYMGNWGNTLDRWYHRAAVVVWPRDQAFANRAKASPAWALNELAAMASAGDVSGAQAAAATLAPFWDGALHTRAPEEMGRCSGLFGKALLAADILDAEGVSARVIDMHTVKPLDREAIGRAAAQTGAIVVAEEHLVDCGLGVRVAQVVAELNPCAMEFVGIHDRYAESGNPDEMLEKYGLVARDIAAAARQALVRKR